MTKPKLKAVCYINQFFGQKGGEECADMNFCIEEQAIGPAIGIDQMLGDIGDVVATIICGDNYFVENLEKNSANVVEIVRKYDADFFFAGPSFNAGRYGVACGEVCKAVQEQLHIPVVTAMYEENPGVEIYKEFVPIVKTSNNARSMPVALEKMVSINRKLWRCEMISPDIDGYFSQGIKKNIIANELAAERVIRILLNKLKGEPYKTEVPLPDFEVVPKSPMTDEINQVVFALVTDGGLYPSGNPDRIESAGATKYGKYDIGDQDSLKTGDYEAYHRGYNTAFVNEDPNRLVPVDVIRQLEKDGVIGALHPYYFATTGVMTSIENGKRIGEEIAVELINAGVQAVIHTST